MSEVTTVGSKDEARRITRLEGLFKDFNMPSVIFKSEGKGWDLQLFELSEQEVETVAAALKGLVRR